MPAANIYRALWRHKVLIALLTLLAAAAAFLWTRTQPSIYEARALVRIQQRDAEPGSLSSLEVGERLARTYAEIVETRSIAQRVQSILRGQMQGERFSLSATPIGDVELLSVAARSESPRLAALAANATTRALREFIAETGTLRDQIVVVDQATVPDTPVLPRTKLTVALALLLALMLNGALALAREFFADRLPGVDEWPTRFRKPVLATVPPLELTSYTRIAELIANTSQVSRAAGLVQAIGGSRRWSAGVSGVGIRGAEK